MNELKNVVKDFLDYYNDNGTISESLLDRLQETYDSINSEQTNNGNNIAYLMQTFGLTLNEAQEAQEAERVLTNHMNNDEL